MVFDIPNHKGSYRERYDHLGRHHTHPQQPDIFANLCVIEKKLGKDGVSACKFVEVAPYQECKDTSHLEYVFQDIVDKGGEGIILRDPNTPYVAGRSGGYLKHKVLLLSPPPPQVLILPIYKKFRDAEAKIIQKTNTYEWECEL